MSENNTRKLNISLNISGNFTNIAYFDDSISPMSVENDKLFVSTDKSSYNYGDTIYVGRGMEHAGPIETVTEYLYVIKEDNQNIGFNPIDWNLPCAYCSFALPGINFAASIPIDNMGSGNFFVYSVIYSSDSKSVSNSSDWFYAGGDTTVYGYVKNEYNERVYNALVMFTDCDNNIITFDYTNANGEYSITAPSNAYKLKVNYNGITTTFIVGGYNCYLYSPGSYNFNLPIDTEATVYGTVTDEDSNTLQGAVVRLRDCDTNQIMVSDTTDSYGYYSMHALAGDYKIEVFYNGYSYMGSCTSFFPPDSYNINPQITTKTTLSGTIRNEHLTSLFGVTVNFRNCSTNNIVASDLTDFLGQYSITALAGSYKLELVYRGYSYSSGTCDEYPPGSHSASFNIVTETTVIGELHDEYNLPIPDATIRLRHCGGSIAASTQTNSSGGFTISALAGDYSFEIEYEGHVYVMDIGGEECNNYAPTTYDFGVLQITSKLTFEGVLNDEDGNHISGAAVEFRDCSDWFVTSDVTDSQGRFSLVTGPGEYKLDVQYNNYVYEFIIDGQACNYYGPGHFTISEPLVIMVNTNIGGTIINEYSERLQGAIARFRDCDTNSVADYDYTDLNGDFDLRALAGDYKFEIEYNGFIYQFLIGGEECVEYPPGYYSFGDIVLQTNVNLDGYLRDLDNIPVEDAKVKLYDCSENYIKQTTSDYLGYFSMSFPRGNYKILIESVCGSGWLSADGETCLALAGNVNIEVVLPCGYGDTDVGIINFYADKYTANPGDTVRLTADLKNYGGYGAFETCYYVYGPDNSGASSCLRNLVDAGETITHNPEINLGAEAPPGIYDVEVYTYSAIRNDYDSLNFEVLSEGESNILGIVFLNAERYYDEETGITEASPLIASEEENISIEELNIMLGEGVYQQGDEVIFDVVLDGSGVIDAWVTDSNSQKSAKLPEVKLSFWTWLWNAILNFLNSIFGPGKTHVQFVYAIPDDGPVGTYTVLAEVYKDGILDSHNSQKFKVLFNPKEWSGIDSDLGKGWYEQYLDDSSSFYTSKKERSELKMNSYKTHKDEANIINLVLNRINGLSNPKDAASELLHLARVGRRYIRTDQGYKNEFDINSFLDENGGQCHDFGNALVSFLRTAQIPSRVVTANSYTDVGFYNQFIKTGELYGWNYHAWTEAYLPGYDWNVFDATPFGIFPSNGFEGDRRTFGDADIIILSDIPDEYGPGVHTLKPKDEHELLTRAYQPKVELTDVSVIVNE